MFLRTESFSLPPSGERLKGKSPNISRRVSRYPKCLQNLIVNQNKGVHVTPFLFAKNAKELSRCVE